MLRAACRASATAVPKPASEKPSPTPNTARWLSPVAAKTAASDAIVAGGGTITHHHAVGRDHAPWMRAEVGDLGLEVIRAAKERLDPAGIMNPGKLLPA